MTVPSLSLRSKLLALAGLSFVSLAVLLVIVLALYTRASRQADIPAATRQRKMNKIVAAFHATTLPRKAPSIHEAGG